MTSVDGMTAVFLSVQHEIHWRGDYADYQRGEGRQLRCLRRDEQVAGGD